MSHENHDAVLSSSKPRPISSAERAPAATIKDVARVSGVSVGTVSNVLSNRGPIVRAEKRTRVLAAARSLNFQPSAAARTLVQGRTRTVGVLFHTRTPTIVVDPYASTILQGILTGAARAGYGVLLYPEPWRGQEHDAQLFADRRVDGILAIAPSLKSIPEMLALNLPLAFVSLDYEARGDGMSDFAATVATDVDNVAGGRIATEYLLSLGHQKIAHLFGDAHQRSAHQREAGWRSALANGGIEPPEEYCIVCNYHGDAAYAATQRLLALPDPPTAIFAANDRLAFECLRAARDANLSVPNDLSVVGFDDVPSASLVTPTLTTIRQPLAQIGSAAVEMLIARLESAAKQAEVPLPADLLLFSPELVVRDSTAPRSHQSIHQRRPDLV